MAHFAKLNSNNKVTQVIVADTREWCEETFGGTWVQTSYNATFGGKFAAIGDDWNGTVFTTPVDTEKEAEIAAKETARNAIASKLGLTADELRALLG